MSSTIKFAMDEHEAAHWLSHGENLDALERFCEKIAPYTNAEIRRIAATQARQLSRWPQSGGDLQRLTLYAHMFFRRQSDEKLYAFKLPAPKYSQVFTDDQVLLPDVGEDFAEWYSALANELFFFDHGALAGSTD